MASGALVRAMLVGREREREEIDRVLERARSGESATLALVGEGGIGKTMLLDHAAQRAAGMRILRARGIESEATKNERQERSNQCAPQDHPNQREGDGERDQQPMGTVEIGEGRPDRDSKEADDSEDATQDQS